MDNLVKAARQKRGMKQADLARRAGVHQSTISGIETGRQTPTVYVALMIARALDTSVEHLFPLAGEGGQNAK